MTDRHQAGARKKRLSVHALLPNGATYYYFSDNAEFAWGQALAEAHSISSVCP